MPTGEVLAGEVLARREGALARLSLNRPKAIHALNRSMCEAMSEALAEWGNDNEAPVVVLIDHAQGRGFCAGGDVVMVRRSALEDGGEAGRAFFHDEYRLNHQLFTYEAQTSVPVVAFMDGITMGGGVGLSQPARYRVATQNTRFAMPESGIGLFPDVGGGWYLSRLKGRLGQWLALTGARMDGAECLWAGLATHYLQAEALPEARARMAAGEAPGAVLDELAVPAPEPAVAAHADDIARHFAFDSYEAILASLRADGGEWAQGALAMLSGKSPLTCKVALRQLAIGLTLPDFAANMAMEYRLAARMIAQPDFAEGVRAVLVDKDAGRDGAPRWNPAAPEGVSEAMTDAIFAPLPAGQEWTPLEWKKP
ncbi:MAG TPA: enoyl-CoA hydratase/isomerase family protein [Novosphingobium sp.]|nr:enoyl-CoA hydratase/isomerase family protein [Novosphingobium sp.]